MYIPEVIRHWRTEWRVFLFGIVVVYVEAVVAGKSSLSQYVTYHEPLIYSKSTLSFGHSRVRRSLNPNEELYLNFTAHGRKFNLCLRRESLLFAHGLLITDDVGSFQQSNIYEGRLVNDPSSYVHGFIHEDVFEGRILCSDGSEYYVESGKQYSDIDHRNIHSVIYNAKDVIHTGPYHYGVTSAKHELKPSLSKYSIKGMDINSLSTYGGKITFHAKSDGARKRRAVDLKKKLVCELHVRADPTYVKYANGDKDRAMYLMIQHVKSVANMFRSTDFSGDGVPEGYTLAIRRIGAIDTSACEENVTSGECKFAGKHIGVAKYLDLVSTDDHSAYCLSYVFTHRNFDDGILGLAFTGFPDAEYPGGICDRSESIDGVAKTFNTGVVSNSVSGRTVSKRITDLTLAHDIAHSFGSEHDKRDDHACAPSGLSGHYLMYSQAQYGTEKNNELLSPCSKAAIWKNLKANSDKCFKEKGNPICGNRIVEPGEDCDCGYANEDSCRKDLCCQGAAHGGYFGCKYSNKAKKAPPGNRCSASQGLCCNPDTCRPYANGTKECGRVDECTKATKCIDSSYKCQTPVMVPERSFCNRRNNICVRGRCSGSLCVLENKIDCQCTEENNLCKLCCQDKTNASSCRVFKWNGRPVERSIGSPCNQYEGRCNLLSKCQYVNEDGVLARLNKWLFYSPPLVNIYEWAKINWWACVLIGLCIILFMMAFVWACKPFVPSDGKRKRKPGRPFLCINRNPENTNDSPSSQSNTSTRNYTRTASEERPQYDDSPPGYNTALRDNLRYPPSYELEIVR